MGQSLTADGALYARDVAVVSALSATAGAGIGWALAGRDGIWSGILVAVAVVPATAIAGIWLASQLRPR